MFGVCIRKGVVPFKGVVFVGVLVPKIAGRREARKFASRDCVVGNGGSGDGEGCKVEFDVVAVNEGAGESVRIARRSSSRSAALSTNSCEYFLLFRVQHGVLTCKSQLL